MSLRRLLFFRFALALVVLLALALLLQMLTPGWLEVILVLVMLLVVLLVVTRWTEHTLATDLKEMGEAAERVVVEGELEAMPQPGLTDLQGLAMDLGEIGSRVKEQYHSLEGEKEKLETVLNNINTGIIVLDNDGKIELINPAAARILGAGQAFALGRALAEIHPSSAIDRAIENSRYGEEGEAEVEITIPRKRVLRVRTSPVRGREAAGEGVPGGVICVLEDLTATRGLERMRRDFVANVSHELRTPVATLRALVEALMSGAMEDLERGQRFLADLDSESGRLAGLVEDLLTLSRLETAEFAPQPNYFPVAELIMQVLDDKRILAERYEVSLEFRQQGEGLIMCGDRGLVRTAVANLVDNAVKYNRSGGRVEVAVTSDDDFVKIVVTDTGIGIPAKDRQRVFERFYRVDRNRSRETGGTGLGLSIVRHVAELHGGSVSLTSIEGEGSTFTLTLSLR